MLLIKLDATDSTNTYLKEILAQGSPRDLTVVQADRQLMGRGQMGTSWVSEPYKNLTISVLKRFEDLGAAQQFRVNIGTSLAVYRTLKNFLIPDLSIKWPNDILSGNRKICGILIENMVSGGRISASVIGMGLNVNQIDFDGLPQVTSLKLETGQEHELDEVLHTLMAELKTSFVDLLSQEESRLFSDYESLLFRKDKPSTFEDEEGKMFMGFIRGVTRDGQLRVELEDRVEKHYGLKEIKLLY
ncbi:biotin--[acetyl-CoA-carboxylase] ligase [Zeaxanthinibacter enoshimensis]|uniref:BirA family biotin operon repressor/biotin-[acetyl-CoA-carboxylase] ligase n=1 Tax=Zeaxanthinibacter enoshimensis TaxID=392009 RepID=A0A4V3D3P6_9FLAO|nr:biotin--[acetyl-CoA-carboxylase] ligase [Zeaxanthinibacter enoshimensis]TDQ30773.1 BirA family biotin operon repressor/biotin-[acetyl-CoA-carboxylase] ligase [Zeaxanthinibacter enoshimensis]